MPVTDPFLTTAEIERIFSAEQRVQRMLDFEAALAVALCGVGMMPADARNSIVACCRADRFDVNALLDSSRAAGNAAIPLVEALTRAVNAEKPAAGNWVHWGATSQDVLDTAVILQLRDASNLVITQLEVAESKLAYLTCQHLRTPMVARTLLQQATAITLGYKLAIWGHAIERARLGLTRLHDDAFALQLGGAVGTLSILGTNAAAVRQAAASQLGLKAPAMTWHAVRDRMTTIGTALATVVTACAKMSQDLMLMMQSEVGEAVESASSAGGSSAMPNKRNPVRALVPVAAAANVGGMLAALYNCANHEHERGAGAWHGEWFALPQLAALAHASACATSDIAGSMVFSPERMRQNLENEGGLVAAEALTAALARVSGKAVARQEVERLCKEVRTSGRSLPERVAESPELSGQLGAQMLASVFSHTEAIDAAAHAAQAWLDRRPI